MTNTQPPAVGSMLTQAVSQDAFVAIQSALLAVTATSGNITFTCNVFGANNNRPVSYMILNTGTKGCYICGSNSAAPAAAIVATSTPAPTTTGLQSNCTYIPPNMVAPMILGFLPSTDTIAAICAGSDSTNLEISIGYGSQV